jgi:hypothetical protein
LIVIRRLVLAELTCITAGPIDPALWIAHVEVEWTHATNLVRPASRQTLEFDHRSHKRGHVRYGQFNMLDWNRPYFPGFPGFGAATAQGFHGAQSLCGNAVEM